MGSCVHTRASSLDSIAINLERVSNDNTISIHAYTYLPIPKSHHHLNRNNIAAIFHPQRVTSMDWSSPTPREKTTLLSPPYSVLTPFALVSMKASSVREKCRVVEVEGARETRSKAHRALRGTGWGEEERMVSPAWW